MITDILALNRGCAYHLAFADGASFDALLMDCDVSIGTETKRMYLYRISDGKIDCSQCLEIPNSEFVGAERIEFENHPQMMAQIHEQIASLQAAYSEKDAIAYEDDVMDALERAEDQAAAAQIIHGIFSEDEEEAFRAAGSVLNNIPFMLKRADQNKMAFLTLLGMMIRLAEHAQWLGEEFSLPILPDQENLFAPENFSMLRKVGYQIKYKLEPKIRVNYKGYARRFVGYIQTVQKSNQRGLILFAGTTRLPFKFSGVADARLRDILDIGIHEVGGIEVEFSIGYLPAEGGEYVVPCGKDVVLTEDGLKMCREASQRVSVSDEFRLSEEYRINPICPTSYLTDELLIGPNRVIREGRQANGADDAENRLFFPMGTKKGRIIRFATKMNANDKMVSEGEIACEGNSIQFNLLQVIDAQLYDDLEKEPEKCIGLEVEFEVAFNAMKNALSVWADAVRLPGKGIGIPPEYDPQIAWSLKRSQQEWIRGEGVAPEYRALQPWLPIMNPLLDNCTYGILDTSSLGTISAMNNTTSISIEGRIYFDSTRTKWCKFSFSSIAEKYLLSLLISSLRYKIAENSMESSINVIFSPQPSGTPGRYVADWVLLTSLGRGGMRKLSESDNISCPKNRDDSLLIDIADGFVPCSLWGKPREMQSKLIQQLGTPDIFSGTPSAGVITQFFNNQGIITASGSETRFSFAMNQIAERSLRESVIDSRYANYPVLFFKRQAPAPKKKKMASPLVADYILSSGSSLRTEPEAEGYRSIIDEIFAPAVPERKAEPEKTEERSRKDKRDKSRRIGRIVAFAAADRPGAEYTLADEHPTLWTMKGDGAPFVCSHLKFDLSRVADQRLKELLLSRAEAEQTIRVSFSLVLCAPGELPRADHICLLSEDGGESKPAEGFIPLGKALEDAQIEEAVRYRGIVTANTAPYNIYVRLTGGAEYQAQGFARQLDFHTCVNDTMRNRFYIMDKALQSALEAGQTGMKVTFIPTAAFKVGREPEAGFVLLDEGDNAYVSQMPEKRYAKSIIEVKEEEPAAVQPLTEAELSRLMYHKEPNAFDLLISGRPAGLGKHFEKAARLFAEGAGSVKTAHTLMVQQGKDAAGYVGINSAPPVMRYAYADALIRNARILFGEDGVMRMLNSLVDIYMAKASGLLNAYDDRAFHILQETYVQLEKRGGDISRLTQIRGRMEKQTELKNGGAISAGHPRFTGDILGPGTASVKSSEGQSERTAPKSTQDSADGTQAKSVFADIIGSVPFLTVMSAKLGKTNGNVYRDWQSGQKKTRNCSFMLELSASPELRADERHRYVCALMDSLLMEAEAGKLSGESDDRGRLLSAAYLYGIVIRLYYQELDRDPGAWQSDETSLYLEFSKKALSFVYTGPKQYNEEKRRLSEQQWKSGYLRQWKGIWELAKEWKIELSVVPKCRNEAEDRWSRRYLLVLLQSVWLSGRTIEEFLTEEELAALYSEAAWKNAVDQLCREFGTAPSGMIQLSESFNKAMDRLQMAIPDLSRQEVDDLVKLGDLRQNQSVLSTIKHLAGDNNNWILNYDTDGLLRQLDQIRRALENPKISEQIDNLTDSIAQLEEIQGRLEKNPNFASHILLEFIRDAAGGVRQQLMNHMKADVKPSLKVAQCSVNQSGEFIVAVEMVSEQYSLRRSGIGLQPGRVPQFISIVKEFPGTFDLSSGEKRTLEFKFRINEELSDFRARGAVEIEFRYTASVQKYTREGMMRGEFQTESGIKLSCPIISEKQSIVTGAFNPSSTVFETQYNSATRAQFVGRENELKKLRDALYDEAAGCYRSGVGMTIAGRRRTGKSWLAGRFCESLREENEGQIIVCDKVDVSGIDRPGDLTEKILQAIINADESMSAFAQEIYDSLKPTMMLQHLAERLSELQKYDVLDQLNALENQLRECGVLNTVSFSAFYSELSRRYKKMYEREMPPILITLDEFTSAQDKIVRGKISRDEILSIIKLTEVYRVNVLLICADNFDSVRAFIDQNAFLHYKTDVWVDGIQEQETIQMLCRPIPVETAGKEQVRRQCIDEEVARQLHRWYDGNVFLIATAAEIIIRHMNANGYIYFESYHLRAASFAQAILRATTVEDFLQAYIEDGRFLDDQYPALVLRWLNIQAMVCVAEEGGRRSRDRVLQRVREEYQRLFHDSDRSRLMNILRQRYEVTAQELPQIAEHIIERFSPLDVINWLQERGVLRIDGDIVTLPLRAYIEARKYPEAGCLKLEKVNDYAADTMAIPTEVDAEDEEVDDPDNDF